MGKQTNQWANKPTHIYLKVVVADEKVPEDPSLIEVAQANHVFNALQRIYWIYIGWQWWQYYLNGCSVHRLDSPLSRQPLLLAVIVNHLVLVLVLYRHYCHFHHYYHISNWTCILPPASLLITRAPRATSNSPFDTGSIQTCSPWFLNILNILNISSIRYQAQARRARPGFWIF